MIAYIPIPNHAIPDERVIESLLSQVDSCALVHCGNLREITDHLRHRDIGQGIISIMKKAQRSKEPYFVTNNSGCFHKKQGAISHAVNFLDNHPGWAGVSISPYVTAHRRQQFHVKQECVVWRTAAIDDIIKYHTYKPKLCSCVTIRRLAIRKGINKFGYLTRENKYLEDIGPGFTIKMEKQNEEIK